MPNDKSWSTVAASPAERVAQDITLSAIYRDLPIPVYEAVADSSTSITINLTTPSDSDALYDLYCSVDGGPYVEVETRIPVSAFPYTHQSLNSATSYSYQVRARNGYTDKALGAVKSAVTLEEVPAALSGGTSALAWAADSLSTDAMAPVTVQSAILVQPLSMDVSVALILSSMTALI